jgi:hypothetical protein
VTWNVLMALDGASDPLVPSAVVNTAPRLVATPMGATTGLLAYQTIPFRVSDRPETSIQYFVPAWRTRGAVGVNVTSLARVGIMGVLNPTRAGPEGPAALPPKSSTDRVLFEPGCSAIRKLTESSVYDSAPIVNPTALA